MTFPLSFSKNLIAIFAISYNTKYIYLNIANLLNYCHIFVYGMNVSQTVGETFFVILSILYKFALHICPEYYFY